MRFPRRRGSVQRTPLEWPGWLLVAVIAASGSLLTGLVSEIVVTTVVTAWYSRILLAATFLTLLVWAVQHFARRGTFYYVEMLEEERPPDKAVPDRRDAIAGNAKQVKSLTQPLPAVEGVLDGREAAHMLAMRLTSEINGDDGSTAYTIAPNIDPPFALTIGYLTPMPPGRQVRLVDLEAVGDTTPAMQFTFEAARVGDGSPGRFGHQTFTRRDASPKKKTVLVWVAASNQGWRMEKKFRTEKLHKDHKAAPVQCLLDGNWAKNEDSELKPLLRNSDFFDHIVMIYPKRSDGCYDTSYGPHQSDSLRGRLTKRLAGTFNSASEESGTQFEKDVDSILDLLEEQVFGTYKEDQIVLDFRVSPAMAFAIGLRLRHRTRQDKTVLKKFWSRAYLMRYKHAFSRPLVWTCSMQAPNPYVMQWAWNSSESTQKFYPEPHPSSISTG